MCCGRAFRICCCSAAAAAMDGQGTHSGAESPLAPRAAEASSAPALISPLQTATVSRSAAPKASSALCHPQDPKPQYPSAAHPGVRGSGARGRRSRPPLQLPHQRTHLHFIRTRQIPSFMDDFIYKQDSRCSSSHVCCFCASGGVPLAQGVSGLVDRWHRDLLG